MAPLARYPSPPEQMLALAIDARERGLAFEDWWKEAIRPGRSPTLTSTPDVKRPSGCVLWPSDSADRNLWRAATEEAKEGWRRTYERLPPTSAESALERLRGTDLGKRLLGEREPARELAAA